MTQALIDAATVFSFEIPTWLPDHIEVGKVCGVTIYAGEVRRLVKALANPLPSTSFDEREVIELLRLGRRIEAIKYRRERTGEGLKQAKDYVDGVGLREGFLERKFQFGQWSIVARERGLS
jgi:hypothetical protein